MPFSEGEAVKILQDLNNSQQSIQSISSWFLSFKDDAKEVVKVWYKEFRKAQPKKKLTFLYLANDVIQNGRKNAPIYIKIFEAVLAVSFKEAAKVRDSSTRDGLTRLLNIWGERGVYSRDQLRSWRGICHKIWTQIDATAAGTGTGATGSATPAHAGASEGHGAGGGSKRAPDASEQRKRTRHHKPHRSATLDAVSRTKKQQPSSASPASMDSEATPATATPTAAPGPSTNDVVETRSGSAQLTTTSIGLSLREELEIQLQKDSVQPPDTSDLLKGLEALQSAASADALTRRTIASFPPDVSSVQAVQNIKSKSECSRLLIDVERCDTTMVEYNERLDQEMQERRKMALQLRAYLLHQADRIAESERKLQEYRGKLTKANKLREHLGAHLAKLPDLSLLPDMTSGLDPLPSVGDLFS